jgi:hypothetical protein
MPAELLHIEVRTGWAITIVLHLQKELLGCKIGHLDTSHFFQDISICNCKYGRWWANPFTGKLLKNQCHTKYAGEAIWIPVCLFEYGRIPGPDPYLVRYIDISTHNYRISFTIIVVCKLALCSYSMNLSNWRKDYQILYMRGPNFNAACGGSPSVLSRFSYSYSHVINPSF